MNVEKIEIALKIKWTTIYFPLPRKYLQKLFQE